MSRLWSATSVICKRQILVTLRSPFATVIEICYPGLATAVLLMLKQAAKKNDVVIIDQSDPGDPGTGAEYICWSLIWAVVFLSSNLKFVQNVMEEKENKVREFIKVYGASDLAYWVGSYLFIALFALVQALVVCVITALYHHDWGLMPTKMFFLIIAFNVSSVSTGMLATSFTDGARAALFIYGTLYLIMMVPYLKSVRNIKNNHVGGITLWHLFMSPQASLICGMDQYMGGFIDPLKYTFVNGDAERPIKISACEVPQAILYLMLLLDGIIYAVFGWYFHQLRPGPLGISRKWNFIFNMSYWQQRDMLQQPRRKLWAETQNFVPQQNHSDLFEYVCQYCLAEQQRTNIQSKPSLNNRQNKSVTPLNHSCESSPPKSTKTADENKDATNSGAFVSGVNYSDTNLCTPYGQLATPTQLFRNSRQPSGAPGNAQRQVPMHLVNQICTCRPLIVVDQLHKIYMRNRLTWQRLKNWMKRKMDLGVVKPPTGVHVLKGINFKVYEGQLTVIMGRNGSGTSTLLSIIGGLQDCSSGNVYIAGHDIHRQPLAARKRIGYCPQSNFFLEKMTIGEQLRFAATLKGVPHHIAKCEIEVILKMLELYDKIDWLPTRLSHGEKKRLSIAMALLGNPRCIVIDDVSTGLDVLSRRVIWRALAEMKKNRAIIVSTHCPSEAEFIADKLGVIESGTLKAYGSPVYLKSRFEEGYVLAVHDCGSKSDSLPHRIMDLLHRYCNEASILCAFGVELAFKIPYRAEKHIPAILQTLELRQDKWGLRNITLSTTRLDYVLERIWDDTAADAERRKARFQPTPHAATLTAFINETIYHCPSGPVTAHCSLVSEVEKSFDNSISSHSGCSESSIDYLDWSAKSEATSSHLSSLACTVDTCEWSENDYVVRVPGYIGNPSVFTDALITWQLARTAWNRLIRILLSVFWKRLHMMRKDGWLLYIQLLLPPLLALFFNVYWLFSPRYSDRDTLFATPADALIDICDGHMDGVPSQFILNRPIGWTLVMRTVFTVTAFELIPSVWGNYVTSERAFGNKLHQHAAGIPLWLYWLGELFWDCFLFAITAFLCFLVMLITKSPLLTWGTYMWLLIALCLYSVSAAAGTFFLSFVFHSGTTIQIVMMSGGVLVPFLVGALHAVGPSNYTQSLTYAFLLVPHSAFAQVCYSLVFDCSCGSSQKECPSQFLGFEMNGLPFLYMTVECVIYFGSVIFLDSVKHNPHLSGFLKKFRCFNPATLRKKLKIDQSLSAGRHQPFPALQRLFDQTAEVENVLLEAENGKFGVEDEQTKVNDAVDHLKKRALGVTAECAARQPVLVADCMSKWRISRHLGAVKTSNFFGRRRYIICDRASFTVKEDELLGFVGLNGCGMSSIMNILSGKTNPTEGKLYINGVDMQYRPQARWGSVGFCSESDVVLEGRLTGREILEMFGRIGLIDRKFLRRTVIPEALAMVCLKDMKNKPVSSYSQGDRRKLSFILSLLTGAKLLILDSPTLGMDITSRRRIWNVISHLKRQQHKAIVVASSSPNECETLSDRIAYLRSGRIVAIGTVSKVKAHLGSCYEVLVNVYAAAALDTPVYLNGHLIVETPCLLYSRLLEKLQTEFKGTQIIEILGTWGRFVIPAAPEPDSKGPTCASSQRGHEEELHELVTGEGDSGEPYDDEAPPRARSRRKTRVLAKGANAADIRDAFAVMRQQEVLHMAAPPPSTSSHDEVSTLAPLRRNSPAKKKRYYTTEKDLLVAQGSRSLWEKELIRHMSSLCVSPGRVSVGSSQQIYHEDGSLTISEAMASPRSESPPSRQLAGVYNSLSSSSEMFSEVSSTTMGDIFVWLRSHRKEFRVLEFSLKPISLETCFVLNDTRSSFSG